MLGTPASWTRRHSPRSARSSAGERSRQTARATPTHATRHRGPFGEYARRCGRQGAMALTSRHLFGPGPTNAYPEATAALAAPLLGHLDPEFIRLMDETCEMLREVWQTENPRTIPLSATGSAGMEAAFVNTVEEGDVVVVAVNGLFGERMCEVARRSGAEVVRVDHEWGQPVDPERVAAAHPNPKIIAAVHAETSTGARSDIAALGELKGDALLLVDAVTSIGGIELRADDWGVDIGYAGTQKCLGAPPGLAPFTINDRAFERRVALGRAAG